MARRNPLSHVWGSEKGLSAMLVFLCLALFVGAPISSIRGTGTFFFDVFFSLLLVSGLITVAGKKFVTAAITVLTFATLVLRWVAEASGSSIVWFCGQALAIVLLGVFTALVLVQVFKDGPVTGYRIQGAVVVYLLVGLIWAAAYQLLARPWPSAFSFATSPPKPGVTDYRMVYYSFITLTTIGYGDITPVHPIARGLAMAEGLVGQLYPAILIARLVSMELETRRRK